jgi:hypothetical protein
LTTQRFSTVISKSGTRTFIAIPFNPITYGASKDATTSRVRLTVIVYAARSALMGRSIFSLWAQPGGEVVALKQAQKWMWFYPRRVRNPKAYRPMSPVPWRPSHKPKSFSSHWQPSIETPMSNRSRAPDDLKHVPRESVRWLNCSRPVRNKNDMD